MKIVCIIPARYKSSRYPGKPLADILGKPLIWWVYKRAEKVTDFDEIYVATDDDRIKKICEELGLKVVMTSENNPTGTDRVAEAAEKIPADLYINIQGDEPLVSEETIKAAITPFFENKNLQVTNLMTTIRNSAEIVNSTIPKVVTNKDGYGLFLSRSPIPYPKGETDVTYFKQVCVYGFKKEALTFYKNTSRGYAERCEDIEILRFIENNIPVKFIEVSQETVAVDTPKDLEKVKKILENNHERTL